MAVKALCLEQLVSGFRNSALLLAAAHGRFRVSAVPRRSLGDVNSFLPSLSTNWSSRMNLGAIDNAIVRMYSDET